MNIAYTVEPVMKPTVGLRMGEAEKKVSPVVQMDYGFLTLEGARGQLIFLVLIDTSTGYKEAAVVQRECNDIDAAKFVLEFIYQLGLPEVQLQSDQEPANDSLKRKVMELREREMLDPFA